MEEEEYASEEEDEMAWVGQRPSAVHDLYRNVGRSEDGQINE